MHSEIVMERVYRHNSRPWLCELGGRNRATLEMHLETMILRVWRYDLGGLHHANLEAVIQEDWRYTSTVWSSEYRDRNRPSSGCTWRARSCKHVGRNGASFDEYLKAADGRHARCWDSYHQLVNSHLWQWDNVNSPLSCYGELAESGWSCREARQKLKLHSGVNL